MVSVLQNTHGSTLGEGEGSFQWGKQCEVEISGLFQKIREKQCLFQRFVTSIVATISLRFGKRPSILCLVDTLHCFYWGEDNDDEGLQRIIPVQGGIICLSQISIHYFTTTIGWQPEEKLLLHSKNVFDYLAIMITINSGNLRL